MKHLIQISNPLSIFQCRAADGTITVHVLTTLDSCSYVVSSTSGLGPHISLHEDSYAKTQTEGY